MITFLCIAFSISLAYALLCRAWAADWIEEWLALQPDLTAVAQ